MSLTRHRVSAVGWGFWAKIFLDILERFNREIYERWDHNFKLTTWWYLDSRRYRYVMICIYMRAVTLNFATQGQENWNRSQAEEIFRYHSVDKTFHLCASSGASCHWDLGACSWDRWKVPTTLGCLVWFRAVLTNTLVGWPHLRMFQFQAGYVYYIKKILHHVNMSDARSHVLTDDALIGLHMSHRLASTILVLRHYTMKANLNHVMAFPGIPELHNP